MLKFSSLIVTFYSDLLSTPMTGMSVYILYLDTKTKNQEDGTDWNNTRISCCPVTSDERTNVVAVKYARLSH